MRILNRFLFITSADLLPAVWKFLVHGSDENQIELVKSKAEVTFEKLPPLFIAVKTLLQNQNDVVQKFLDIFGLGFNGYTSTQLICCVFVEVLAYIFRTHLMGRTWNGEFSIADMYAVGKSQFGIAKVPSVLPGNASDIFSAKRMASVS